MKLSKTFISLILCLCTSYLLGNNNVEESQTILDDIATSSSVTTQHDGGQRGQG